MRGRKGSEQEELGRRRPVQSAGSRPQNYSYYSQPRTAADPRGADGHQVARREPLPRDKRELLHYVGQRFGVVIAIFATLALLISSVQVSMSPRIQIVNDTEVYRIHANSLYQEALTRQLKSSWTNTNKITINSTHIASELKREYPELADVSVTLPVLGQRPIAYLQLTRPSLILVSNSGAAFVLDEAGRVLAPASQVNNLDAFQLPTVTDQSGLDAQVGQLVLSGPTVSFIRGVTYQLQTAHLSYSKLILPQAAQELDVYVTGKPYYARFNTHEDSAREQAGALLAVQASLVKKGTQPSSYIDVRLPGRAYYK